MLADATRLRNDLAGSLLAAVLVLAGCSSGDDTPAVDEDELRTASSFDVAIGRAASEYCRTADAVTSRPEGLDASQDAAAAISGLEQLAALAPADLSGAFDTLLRGLRGTAATEQDDPSAPSGVLDLRADPELAAAVESIERFTSFQCSIDLGAAMGIDRGGEPDGAPPDSREITVADVKAVFEANQRATWADKLPSVSIDGLDVVVRSDGSELVDVEAVVACTTLWLSLSEIQPEVAVAVGTPQRVIARSTGYGCE